MKSLLELNPEKRVRSKKLYESLSKYEQQILDLEPFDAQPSRGYNQYSASGYYNQPYQQQYSNIPQNPQPPQGYNYSGISGVVGHNPHNIPNVRWPDNQNFVNPYKRPWLIWRFCFVISFIFILFSFISCFQILIFFIYTFSITITKSIDITNKKYVKKKKKNRSKISWKWLDQLFLNSIKKQQ